MIERLAVRAQEPRDAAGLAAFRILFGLLCSYGAVRFLVNGWVDRFFVAPRFFFKYWGFEWVAAGDRTTMIGVFVALAVLGMMIAAGAFYRLATAAFFVLFTYVELIDVTNYLNHYYLVSLLALLLVAVPLHRSWSFDVWRTPSLRRETLPAWATWAFQTQVGLVYVGAALAKAGPDWLLHAEPLGIWMRSRTDVPLIGAVVDEPWVALVMSWAGFLNDAVAVPFLLNRRTRPWMYAVLVVFHAFTRVFFNIGLFPIIMLVAATVFFDADWPRAVLSRVGRAGRFRPIPAPAILRLETGHRLGPARLAVFGALLCAQLVLPLRAHFYGGDVLWHEQGMRFAWRVMVREKNGAVTFRVKLPGRAHALEISPRRYLTDYQEREMAGQPDLILQLAHRVASDFASQGTKAAVYADAFVSLNGRAHARLIDPSVNLTTKRDGIEKATWILPAPPSAPLRVAGTLHQLLAKAP